MMMKKKLLWLFAGLFLSVPLAYADADAAQAESPEALVKQTTERVLKALHEEGEALREQPKALHALVNEIVLPHFDFEAMARAVLARYWRRATPEQRERFTEEFRTLLVRTYATSLTDYSNEKVRYLPSRSRGDDQVLVRTEVQQPGAYPVPVEYELSRRNGEWKVTGVIVDDLNLVLNYRTSFAAEIRRHGLQGTIDKLAERNQGGA